MNKLIVKIDFGKNPQWEKPLTVGQLYLSKEQGKYLFEYDRSFTRKNLSISPLILPLNQQTHVAEPHNDMYGLHGVFADSLPDNWGRKVQDFEFEKIELYNVTALDRLSFVGRFGIGALQYKPENNFNKGDEIIHLATLRKTAQGIISGNIDYVTKQLLRSGGSAGGARPKFLVNLNVKNNLIKYTLEKTDVNYKQVVLKIPEQNSDHWQRIEYVYSKMAQMCGINIPDTYLITGEDKNLAYYAIERFDILKNGEKLHVHTLAGLLNRPFSSLSIDYVQLLRLTQELTLDHRAVTEIYLRMVFNYLAGNNDDHSKNFSFTMNYEGKWKVSPAYDISYSPGINGMHAMSAEGKRRNLTKSDFRKIAENFNISNWEQHLSRVTQALTCWINLAEKHNVPLKYIKIIKSKISENTNRILKK